MINKKYIRDKVSKLKKAMKIFELWSALIGYLQNINFTYDILVLSSWNTKGLYILYIIYIKHAKFLIRMFYSFK